MSRRVRAHRPINPEILEFDPALVLRLTARSRGDAPQADDESINRVQRALRRAWNAELTPLQKKYLLLYYQGGMRMREIAARYGVTVPTVSRTVMRGRERLRQVLQYYL